MALAVGSRLGRCDATARIVEGGMGELYQPKKRPLNHAIVSGGVRILMGGPYVHPSVAV